MLMEIITFIYPLEERGKSKNYCQTKIIGIMKEDLKRELRNIESVTNCLSTALRSLSLYDVEDKELEKVLAGYISQYHVKAANLALELKNA